MADEIGQKIPADELSVAGQQRRDAARRVIDTFRSFGNSVAETETRIGDFIVDAFGRIKISRKEFLVGSGSTISAGLFLNNLFELSVAPAQLDQHIAELEQRNTLTIDDLKKAQPALQKVGFDIGVAETKDGIQPRVILGSELTTIMDSNEPPEDKLTALLRFAESTQENDHAEDENPYFAWDVAGTAVLTRALYHVATRNRIPAEDYRLLSLIYIGNYAHAKARGDDHRIHEIKHNLGETAVAIGTFEAYNLLNQVVKLDLEGISDIDPAYPHTLGNGNNGNSNGEKDRVNRRATIIQHHEHPHAAASSEAHLIRKTGKTREELVQEGKLPTASTAAVEQEVFPELARLVDFARDKTEDKIEKLKYLVAISNAVGIPFSTLLSSGLASELVLDLAYLGSVEDRETGDSTDYYDPVIFDLARSYTANTLGRIGNPIAYLAPEISQQYPLLATLFVGGDLGPITADLRELGATNLKILNINDIPAQVLLSATYITQMVNRLSQHKDVKLNPKYSDITKIIIDCCNPLDYIQKTASIAKNIKPIDPKEAIAHLRRIVSLAQKGGMHDHQEHVGMHVIEKIADDEPSTLVSDLTAVTGSRGQEEQQKGYGALLSGVITAIDEGITQIDTSVMHSASSALKILTDNQVLRPIAQHPIWENVTDHHQIEEALGVTGYEIADIVGLQGGTVLFAAGVLDKVFQQVPDTRVQAAIAAFGSATIDNFAVRRLWNKVAANEITRMARAGEFATVEDLNQWFTYKSRSGRNGAIDGANLLTTGNPAELFVSPLEIYPLDQQMGLRVLAMNSIPFIIGQVLTELQHAVGLEISMDFDYNEEYRELLAELFDEDGNFRSAA